ncbi:MAG: histidinol dehydrogenase, partial [Chitinivibrionales bacterium]
MVSDELISLINLKEVSADAGLEGGWKRDTGIPEEVTERVKGIIRRVIEEGDSALFSLTEEIEGRPLNRESVRVSHDEIDASAGKLSDGMKDTVKEAIQRIERYHSEQGVKSFRITTDEARLSQIVRPIERAGIYIPGGHTVYPSSVLMNVVPARIAGVSSIAAVTPFKGELDPGIAFALKELGVSEFYRVGGAQAIAALAYGTESIRGVDKIVGPGGAYVAEAKRLVYGSVDIDSIAGPSEVAVIADTTANPLYIALDMLSQAEHGS